MYQSLLVFCLWEGAFPVPAEQPLLAPLLSWGDPAVPPAGSCICFDWMPWSTSFCRKDREGSKTSFLPVPLFQFLPFGRREFDFFFFPCDYYGLPRTALKLALRRWKGRESSLQEFGLTHVISTSSTWFDWWTLSYAQSSP